MRFSYKFWYGIQKTQLLFLSVVALFIVSCADGLDNSESDNVRTPINLIANPGARTVELSWQGDPAVTSYTVYWQVGSEVDTKESAHIETVSKPYFVHASLTNGATYYYRVSAHKGQKESEWSSQVQATPQPIPPDKPTIYDAETNPDVDGFRAFAGDARVTLTWPMDTSEGALKYTLLWQHGGGVSPASARRIDDVVSPFVHEGLDNGQLYSYRLVGVNDEGESEPSDEVTATPQKPLPNIPINLRAVENAVTGQITLQWDQYGEADSFELYWSTTADVGLTSQYVSNLQSPFVHAPLVDNDAYYYRVRAINSAGASALSGTLQATAGTGSPQSYQPLGGNAPAAPGDISLKPGDGQVRLKWQPVDGATGYLIYWNTTGDVSEADARVSTAPLIVYRDLEEDNNPERVLYVHTGLANGQNYYYRIAAFNGVGQTLSAQVGPVRAEKIVPGRPANVHVLGGDSRIGVRWNPVHNADSYNIYWKEAGFGGDDGVGTLIADVSSPFVIDNSFVLDGNGSLSGGSLVNGATYQIRIEAVAAGADPGCQPPPATDGVTAKPVPCTEWFNVTPQIPPPQAPEEIRLVPGDSRMTVQWAPNTLRRDPDTNQPLEDIVYHVYRGERPGVIPGSGEGASRRVDAGPGIPHEGSALYQQQDASLVNGKRYYYIVTASNAGGESLPSKELWAIPQVITPQSPRGLSATPGNTNVTLTWIAPDNSTNYSYNIYYRTGNGASPVVIPNAGVDITAEGDAELTYRHTINGLTNGINYYFKVSAINEGGEGVFSSEVNTSPYLPPPRQAPAGITILGGDQRISLSWNAVNAADRYKVYWSTTTPINLATAPKILVGNGATEFVHEGRQNGTTYYYRITAANAGGESSPSDLVFATAQVAPPNGPPANFTAIAGNAQVRFDWNPASDAQSYSLYWSRDMNLPINQWMRVSGVEPEYVQTGLTNGVAYHFFLRAINPGGHGPASTIVSVTPQLPPPEVPSGFSVSPGDATVSINWDSRAGVAYNLYWSTTANVEVGSSTVVPNVTSTYVHSGLDNGTTYYYRLAAVNAGGQSPLSAELSATPAAVPPGAPTGVNAQGRNGQVELRWFPPSGASSGISYTLYWSTTPGVGTAGTPIANVSSPYVHTGLSNGTTYYYVITATDGAESTASLQVSATPSFPQVGMPGNFQARAGVGEVLLTWGAAANAQIYTVYWSNDPSDPNPQQITVLTPATHYRHTGLSNGDTYYYRIRASNSGNVSSLSSQVSATPIQAPNQPPLIVGNELINRSVARNGTISIDLTATDPDSSTLNWSLDQPPSNGSVSFIGDVITGNNVSVVYSHTATDNNNDGFWVRVEDDQLGFDRVQIQINIQSDINEPPAITTTPNASVEENVFDVFTLGGSDPENDSLTFRITGGADSSAFYIVPGDLPNTAHLRLIRAADFEVPADTGGDNVYNVQITANDGVNDSASQNLALTITNVPTENTILGIFPDPNLQQCVNEYASRNDWKYTYQITGTLECIGRGISDLTGMEQLVNLQGLDLRSNSITDVTPLTGLSQLSELSLAYNNLASLAPPEIQGIAALDNVTRLWLYNNNISDFSPLTGMVNLRELIVWHNNINDLTNSNLASLTNLTKLWLMGNPISDVSALSNFTNLTDLGLSSLGLSITSPSQITGLSTLSNLQVLYLQSNGLANTTGLQSLTNLRELWLYGNQIRDVQDVTGLPQLSKLGLGFNGLTSADMVVGLDQLASLQELWLPENTMTDISALDNPNFQTNLINLYLYTNQISDVSVLQNLTSLRILYLNENPSLSNITWLAGLDGLTELYLGLTSITNINALANKTNLRSLGISVISGVSDFTPLSSLTNLEYLYLGEAGINDTNISALNNLFSLKELYLWGNAAISNLADLSQLTSLEVLDLTSNLVANPVGIEGLLKLRTLNLNNNQVSNLAPLQNLYGLKEAALGGNNIVDVSALLELNRLSRLSLFDNSIVDVGPLAGLERLYFLELNNNLIHSSGNGNVDQLVSFMSPSHISLYGNPVMDCAQLQTLIDAYPSGVVPPDTYDPQRHCTDYAAINSTGGFSSNWASPTAGDTITITVQAYDDAGNPKTTGGDVVEITSQFPGVNLPGGTILTVVDNGDGTYTASYTPSIAGQDSFLITINGAPIGPKDQPDSNGILNGILSIDVIVNQQPIAVIAQPTNTPVVNADDPLDFDSIGSRDPDGHAPLTYQWTFTLGGEIVDSSSLPNPTMSFSTAGDYEAELIVYDAIGLASTMDTVSFTVVYPVDVTQSYLSVQAGPYAVGDVISLWAQVLNTAGQPTTADVVFNVTGSNAQSLTGVYNGSNGWYYATYNPLATGSDQFELVIDSVAKTQVETRSVISPIPIVAMAAGPKHNCAINQVGELKCWGASFTGELGLGTKMVTEIGSAPEHMGANLRAVDLGASLQATKVAMGRLHTCAILNNGAVKCWGYNAYGQLGLGYASRPGDEANELGDNLPTVDLGSGRTATAIAAGNYHTCALLDNGQVKCWGDNTYAQLGLGDSISRGLNNDMGDSLAAVNLGAAATGITAGESHSCALLQSGNIKCWGTGSAGSLGLEGINSIGYLPEQMGTNLPVVDLNGALATAVASNARARHTCALLSGGEVKCWGINSSGQLGQGDKVNRGLAAGTMGTNLAAIDLGGLAAIAISVGADHSCALLSDDSVKCWGDNAVGQVGQQNQLNDRGDEAGEMGANLPPIDLAGGSVSEISAGEYHSCVRFFDGQVKCWGQNRYGELGLGDTLTRGYDPALMGVNLPYVDLGGLTAVGITASREANCVILNDNSLKCWGRNVEGQLGLGLSYMPGDEPGEMGSNLPALDLGINRTATAVSAGGYSAIFGGHSCAVLDNGTVKCWGLNEHGQLGQSDTNDRGDDPNEMGDNLPPVDLGVGIIAVNVSSGRSHSCALLETGLVKCWGHNSDGQLGTGNTEYLGDGINPLDLYEMGDSLLPIELGLGRTVLSVKSGYMHNCALLDNGAVKCWGSNFNGQLGLGPVGNIGDEQNEMGDSLTEVNLGTGRTAVSIALGKDHSCALLDNGTVKCWGRNRDGQLGYPDTANNRGDAANEMGDNLPVVDLGGQLAVSIHAGYNETCAQLTDGSVKCWGGGKGATPTTEYFGSVARIKEIVVGGSAADNAALNNVYKCALFENNVMRCVGENYYGQLGNSGVNFAPVEF